MIISGGVNIYPREVEDVLIGHPLVDDVAVIGVPDEEMGEAVRAVVQPPAGTDPASLDASGPELVEFCRERLSHLDRKSGGEGKSGSVRVDLGGGGIIKK